MALLVGLPPAPIAQRTRGEKALALQQLLLGRGGGWVRGWLFPCRELFAHDGSKVTDRLANFASMQRVRDSNLWGAKALKKFRTFPRKANASEELRRYFGVVAAEDNSLDEELEKLLALGGVRHREQGVEVAQDVP